MTKPIAILSNKRLVAVEATRTTESIERDGKVVTVIEEFEQYYIVDTRCSACGHRDTIAFAGWARAKCGGCKQIVDRGQYSKINRK